MKIGKVNKILDNVNRITTTSSGIVGAEISLILDPNTLKKWSDNFTSATIQVVLDEAITSEIICLFNICVTGTVEVKTLTELGVVTNTHLFTSVNTIGIENKHLLAELSNKTTPYKIIQITVNTTPATELYNQGVAYGVHGFGSVGFGVTYLDSIDSNCFLGYLWAGDTIDFGCVENMQPFDNTSDIVNITRSNVPDVQRSYKYQTFNITLKKPNRFITLRDNIRYFINDGIGKARPFLFDEPCYDSTELVYGIFDATRFGYDIFYAPIESGDFIAQATIGVREVF